jgi:hypothetical protein
VKRFDLLPASFAFSNFLFDHAPLRIAAHYGVEDEYLESVHDEDDAPDKGNPLTQN